MPAISSRLRRGEAHMPNPVLSSLLRINRQRLRALKCGLAPYQYVGIMHLIVIYVHRTPGASQEEICSYYALDKAGVAWDARRLEDMGHIRRETNPDNRRQYQLFLTSQGEAMVPVLDRIYDEFVQRISAGLSAEDWQLLTELLKKVEITSYQTAPPCKTVP